MLSVSLTYLTHHNSALHLVLFVRACVETHQIRTAPVQKPDVPVSDEKEVAVVRKHESGPVIVPVSTAGGAGTTDVYMITGPDGRPQLLVPLGTNLVAVPSGGDQQVQTVEADSTQRYELGVLTRINELDARQWEQVPAGGHGGQPRGQNPSHADARSQARAGLVNHVFSA